MPPEYKAKIFIRADKTVGGNSILSFRVISIPSNENAGYIHKYFYKASLKSFFLKEETGSEFEAGSFPPLNPSSLGTTKGQSFGILQVILCKFTWANLKRVTRLAQSVLVALLEACYSPRSERVTRLARSVLVATLEASCSPRPKRVSRPARSELLAPPGAS